MCENMEVVGVSLLARRFMYCKCFIEWTIGKKSFDPHCDHTAQTVELFSAWAFSSVLRLRDPK